MAKVNGQKVIRSIKTNTKAGAKRKVTKITNKNVENLTAKQKYKLAKMQIKSSNLTNPSNRKNNRYNLKMQKLKNQGNNMKSKNTKDMVLGLGGETAGVAASYAGSNTAANIVESKQNSTGNNSNWASVQQQLQELKDQMYGTEGTATTEQTGSTVDSKSRGSTNSSGSTGIGKYDYRL